MSLNKSAIEIKNKTERDKFLKIINSRLFIEPQNMLYDRYQIVDEKIKNIFLLGKNSITKKSLRLQRFDNINIYIKSLLENTKNKFLISQERIDNFSPLGTLKRGYSVVRNNNKKVIKSIHEVDLNQEIEIILETGKLIAEVKGKNE